MLRAERKRYKKNYKTVVMTVWLHYFRTVCFRKNLTEGRRV